MTPEEINIIRTRYCSISPRKMQDILSCSAAAYKLVQDIPVLLAEIKRLKILFSNQAFSSIPDVEPQTKFQLRSLQMLDQPAPSL